MAATADTRQLQLQISASAELLIRNLKQADNAVADFQRSTDRRLGDIDGRFAAVGELRGKLSALDGRIGLGGLASAATGVTLVELAQRGLDYASSLGEVAQQLGVTTKDLQTYRYAASQVGIEQEEIDKSLAKLTVTMGKARQGAKEPKAAFEQLSKLLGRDLLESAATAGDAIPLIAEALQKVEDPAKRAAIEVSLFGKTGQKLDTLLSGGAAGVNDLAKAAQDLGLVLSEDEIANADNAADKISELKQVLEANIAGAVANNAKAIYELVVSLEKLIGVVPAALNGLGKLRAYMNLAQGVLNGDQDEVASARRDIAVRENYGKPFFGDAARASAARYAQRVIGGRGAGAGTADADGEAAAAKASREAEKSRREAAAAAKKDRADKRRAEDTLARAEADVLSARADLSNDPEQRLAIEHQRIDLAKAARDRDLDEEAIDNRFIAANLDALKLANMRVAQLDKDLASQRVAQANDQEEFERRRAAADDAIALDEIAASLTVVNRDRYAIEKRILAAKQQEERDALERIQANVAGQYTPQQVTTASQALDRLPGKQAAERGALDRSQQGPLTNYRDQLRAASEDTNEALQQIAVRGFGQLEDAGSSAIASSVTNLLKLKGVAGSVVGSIIADLARLAIQKAIVSAIGGSFFGLATGGSIGSIPGRAEGGSLGGLIQGPGTGTSDSILAMLSGPGGGAVRLSNREFIMNAGAVDFYGADTMAAINARRLPRFAAGGSLGGGRLPNISAPRLPDLSGAGDRPQRLAVDVNATIDASPEFDVRMQGVAARTVGAAAEPIMAGATSATIRKLRRPGLPGGWG